MNPAGHIPVLIIVIPLLSSLLIPILGKLNRELCWYAVISITLLSFIFSVYLLTTVMQSGTIHYWLGGWEPPWGIEYVIDYLNGYVLVIISFIAFIISIYSRKSIGKDVTEDKIPFFYSIYLLFITALLGVSITGDIFNLYVFIEILALSGYALIALGKNKNALIASYNYLILGTIAATFILIGIGYLYMVTGSLNMADLRILLPPLYNTTAVKTAFAFFTVGLSLKLALFPLHVWLPNVYTHSPPVVSALMAATSSKVSAYVLIRIMFTVFKVDFDLTVLPVTKIFIVLACAAIIAGSVLAIGQTNIKRMLAYSSVGQIGYIVLGAALTNQRAMTGGLLHILNHALMKGTLFLVVGSVVYKTGTENISDMKGLGKKMPYTMAAFTIGALSMIGFPLTAGFVSKWYLALGALDAHMWYLIPVILTSSLLSAIYFWRVIEGIFFHKKSDGGNMISEESERGEAPASMLIPTLILAGLCIFFGLASFIPLSIVTRAADMLLGVR